MWLFRKSIMTSASAFKFVLIQKYGSITFDKTYTIYESLISKKVRKANTSKYKVTIFNHCFDIIVRTI